MGRLVSADNRDVFRCFEGDLDAFRARPLPVTFALLAPIFNAGQGHRLRRRFSAWRGSPLFFSVLLRIVAMVGIFHRVRKNQSEVYTASLCFSKEGEPRWEQIAE